MSRRSKNDLSFINEAADEKSNCTIADNTGSLIVSGEKTIIIENRKDTKRTKVLLCFTLRYREHIMFAMIMLVAVLVRTILFTSHPAGLNQD